MSRSSCAVGERTDLVRTSLSEVSRKGTERAGLEREFPFRSPSRARWLARALAVGIILASATAIPAARAAQHTLPVFTPDGDLQQGFARIINHSNRGGTVRIHGTDDTGRSRGPITLSIGARATRHFNSGDLERGNPAKGLPRGLGNGSGRWRLRLESDLDIEAAAYIRTGAGFLASVHDVVSTVDVAGETVHHVPIFNPGSNHDQVSWLRLANLTGRRVDVTIEGRDDAGRPASGGGVRVTLPANGARRISAQQLESGAADFTGRLGAGTGKWQLFVTADGDLEVVSLLQTPTGHLTNLSVSGLGRTQAPEPSPTRPAGSTFRDCAGCPLMVVVPAGSFRMGSPAGETNRDDDEGPVHRVTIGEPLAVGRYEVTFAEWDACHRAGGCTHRPDDQGWGRGNRPVVDVSWNDSREYVRWLSSETGRSYRLLSESEWEYVARAGTTTRYWWGDAIGRNQANCDGCGSPWDARQSAPVGSFSPNPFGLHDVHGNVWEWVQDCRNTSYFGAPLDGSAWESGDCSLRTLRGGSWQRTDLPRYLRSANRGGSRIGNRLFDDRASIGLRVARSLAEPTLHTLPLFRPAGQSQQGFARIINRSRRAGTVRVHGTDDAGWRRGPVDLWLDAEATRHFNSGDLEGGNVSKGLTGALGKGTGDWRLELSTDLDIEPSAYIRTADGFLTAMHAVVRTAEVEGETVHQVPIFNPGRNRDQVSWLRLANLTDSRVNVTIRARDDAGASSPLGEVRLSLPANGARRISAQQLESGSPGLVTGRLGDGDGKWQLAVTADGAIEVVSLLQSPTGHLSNVSTTPRVAVEATGFEIVADGPTTVGPLETIQLRLPEGFTESGYLVLMDLSGTGAFGRIDTVEVEGLATDEDRILFASPLTQALADINTSHSFAVRVRREADGQVSNVLNFSIEDVSIPAHLAGYPTIALEVVLHSLFTASDDPLLGLGAPSIQPGLTVESARRLNLDTALSDVQAEAILQSLFGASVADWAAGIRPRSAAGLPVAPLAEPGSAPVPGIDPDIRNSGQRCPNQLLCDALYDMMDCIGGLMARFTPRSGRLDASACSETRFRDRLVESWEDYTGKLASWLTIGRQLGGRLARKLISRRAIQQLSTSNAMLKPVVEASKSFRTLDKLSSGIRDGLRHLARDRSGTLLPTRRGLASNYENARAISQEVTQDSSELIREAEMEFANRNLDDHEREAFSEIVNESDRLRREAETIDELEDVYHGEKDPRDAIGNDPSRGVAVAENCEYGYEEFPIDDETSTCVFESLVEPNCYPGSRRVRNPDLGRERDNVCLYYSLDFFQPNGTCRQNYDRVYFQGRWTCRWEELEPEEPAWYTLRKVEEDNNGPQQWTHIGLDCVDVRLDRFENVCRDLGLEGKSQQVAIVTNNCARDVRMLVAWRVPPEFSDPLFGDWTNYFNTYRPGQWDPVTSGFCLDPERTLPLRTCAHYDRPGVFIDPSCPLD